MIKIIKNLWLGIFILALISGILLFTDKSKNTSRQKSVKKEFKIAAFQYSSRPLLDVAIQGALDGLAEKGFKNGENLIIKRYNSENDMVTANSIAKEIALSDFNMVLTASTPCLQVMANANKEGRVIHVFSTVTDPYGAGVGIDEKDHLKHPKHLAGIGTFQPVESAFKLAKEMYPDLKVVGTPWTTSEKCAEACVFKARKICDELGIKLLESPVENTTGILDACKSLISQGAQALWVGGDNNVELALDIVVKTGLEANIPVFGNSPEHADKGAIFGIGGNYYEVGKAQGYLAADILNGKDPSTISIDNVVPEKLFLNKKTQKAIRDKWFFSDSVIKSASKIIDENGSEIIQDEKEKIIAAALSKQKTGKVLPAKTELKSEISPDKNQAKKDETPIVKIKNPNPSEKYKLFLILYNDSVIYEETEKGIIDGLKEAGMERDINYTLVIQNAHGDIATLNSICNEAKSQKNDIIITGGTMTLQSAIKNIHDMPIVFTTASDPISAGAGNSFDEHLPNVTGISTVNDVEKMVRMIKQIHPGVKKIGTLFTTSEVNSITYKTNLEMMAKRYGLGVELVSIDSSAETLNCAQVLCSKPIEVIVQIPDNIAIMTFTSIDKASRNAKMPIYTFFSDAAEKGQAIMTLSRDYYDCAKEASQDAVRIINGENPKDIPIRYPRKSKVLVNLETAKFYNVVIPKEILDSADKVIGK